MPTVDAFNILGHQAVCLENGFLRIVVLPQKGCDIYEFTHLPSGVQFLMRTPWGLQPPKSQPPSDFLENYEGGWQTLFPNINDACTYRGIDIPFHGEAALLPWEYKTLNSTPDEARVKFWVNCRRLPFRLERIMTLREDEPILYLEESLINLDNIAWEYVWCHHLVLGGDFIEQGCRIEIPARRLTTPPILYEPETARLAPGQESNWPLAQSRQGESMDLRHIPGPQAHAHDDAMLGDLANGVYHVTNSRLGLRFGLQWDTAVFPWVMFWMPYGGAVMPPLTGVYGVGLEPTSSPFPLTQSSQAGVARALAGGETLKTSLKAWVQAVT